MQTLWPFLVPLVRFTYYKWIKSTRWTAWPHLKFRQLTEKLPHGWQIDDHFFNTLEEHSGFSIGQGLPVGVSTNRRQNTAVSHDTICKISHFRVIGLMNEIYQCRMIRRLTWKQRLTWGTYTKPAMTAKQVTSGTTPPILFFNRFRSGKTGLYIV